MLKTSAALIAVLSGWAYIGSCRGSFAEEGATRGLASREAPPLPQVSALAQPRPRKQAGLPEQLTQATIPKDNPLTPEKVALGEKLFFDSRLSADGTVACATCHDPARAFTDGRPVSIGIHGRAGQRNAPTVLNALFNKAQFWDGRATTLEEQAAFPIVNPVEMGQPTLEAAVAGIAGIAEYRQAFLNVFGRPADGQNLLRAIAAYERTLVSFDSPFDHFIAGDKNAIDDSAKRGWRLFNAKARCNKCHALTDTQPDVVNFMDYDFHNIGIGIIRHNVVALARPSQAADCFRRHGGRRSRRHRYRIVRARSVPRYQEGSRYCFVQDAEFAERAGNGAVFSRRFARDPLGRRGSLQ